MLAFSLCWLKNVLIDHLSENIFVMGVRVSFVLFDALFHSRITDRVSFWVINCEVIDYFFSNAFTKRVGMRNFCYGISSQNYQTLHFDSL